MTTVDKFSKYPEATAILEFLYESLEVEIGELAQQALTEHVAYTAIGFLSASIIALSALNDSESTALFCAALDALNLDLRSYPVSMQHLLEELDKLIILRTV